MVTKIIDGDEELLVRHFCIEDEVTHLLSWFSSQGHTRPEYFSERIKLGDVFREKGNELVKKEDWQGAMLNLLSGLHCIDFSHVRRQLQSADETGIVNQAVVRIVSNLSLVFLKRGDGYNSARAADLALEYLKKSGFTREESDAFRCKLLFRRGLAKGQRKEFEEALPDLKEAARLAPQDREVRKALENCKLAVVHVQGAPDDKWRGLLTEDPQKAKSQAKRKRFWQKIRMTGQFLLSGLASRKQSLVLKVLCLLIGPMLLAMLPAFVQTLRR